MNPNIFYRPWDGTSYGKSSCFGFPLMILGESHYGDESYANRELTCELTRDYIKGEFTHAFWTRIARITLGQRIESFNEREFWNHVVFYNYVQNSAGDQARKSPSKEDFQKSEKAFFQVLDDLKPDLVIMMGKRLWENASTIGKKGPPVKIDSTVYDTWLYPHAGGWAFAFAINHPSSFGFNTDKWTSVIQHMINIKLNQ